jgi:hypothetical protein
MNRKENDQMVYKTTDYDALKPCNDPSVMVELIRRLGENHEPKPCNPVTRLLKTLLNWK